MFCPFCGADDTKVIDSRLVAEGGQVRRRRECVACRERFTTYEAAELVMPRVIKQDGSREPFDEDKLRSGLQRALEKRPVAVEAVESELVQIKNRLRATGEREPSPSRLQKAERTTNVSARPLTRDDRGPSARGRGGRGVGERSPHAVELREA